ncbi:MAG TPA: MoxR family ATPase, partial [Acidimicrobiales bacterium]|nr:MoxR family ATPase [Acidimicrobiales bacterium]
RAAGAGTAEPGADRDRADMTLAQLSVDETADLCDEVMARVGEVVVGKQLQLRLVLAGLLAGGHVLLEDVPGLGKTLTARSFAQALGLGFRRVQFTPDLLPSDISGSFVYNQHESCFELREGPIFTNLLLADEINRTPPRTQAALLEAMQEGQVTIEGETRYLPRPFHVLATANPIEYEGTYPLPEAQLDRFLLRISFGYLEAGEELQILHRRISRGGEASEVHAVVGADGLLAMQASVEGVVVEDSVGYYVVEIVRATRRHPQVLVGSSPRGALAVMLCARALAAMQRRDYVVPDDVKAVAVVALAHRLTLRPEAYLRRVGGSDIVQSLLAELPVPTTSLPGGAHLSSPAAHGQAAVPAVPGAAEGSRAAGTPASDLGAVAGEGAGGWR